MARGRRSDHNTEQMLELIIGQATDLVAAGGISAVTAREVARGIGYSATTVLNLMGSADAIVTAVNTRTFGLWADHLEKAMAERPEDRIAALVHAYFDFAQANPRLWISIYEHKPTDHDVPEDQMRERSQLTAIVAREIASVLPAGTDGIEELTASLVHTVHGHCHLWITGTSEIMGLKDVRSAALDRVTETLAARGRLPTGIQAQRSEKGKEKASPGAAPFLHP